MILKHIEGHYNLNEEENFFASCVLLVVRTSHYLGPVYTMDQKSDHGRWPFPWSDLMVQLPWSDFLRKNNLQSLWGPSLGVNQMWSKRNNHAPKSECVFFLFFNICPKRAFKKKDSSLTILLFSLGLHLSSLLAKCVEDVACKSSYNNFYKKNEPFNLYTFDVIYM